MLPLACLLFFVVFAVACVLPLAVTRYVSAVLVIVVVLFVLVYVVLTLWLPLSQ